MTYKVIPSKEIIEEFKGEIFDQHQFKETTKRGKDIIGFVGRIDKKSDEYYIFAQNKADAKSLVSHLKKFEV